MRVKLGEKTLIVNWAYGPSENPLAQVDTICRISELQEDGKVNEIIRGKASCSLADRFTKETGRKLSLQRALLTKIPVEGKKQDWPYLFQREDRIRVWKEYFVSRGIPVPKELGGE